MNTALKSIIASLAFALTIHTTAPVIAADSGTTEVKLATLLPEGTSGFQSLMEMRDTWQKTSAQSVRLTIYGGGKQGGESEVVQKIRQRQLHASVLTVVGLSEIDPAVSCLQIMPMMFRSWAEVDHVREKIRPELEKRLLDKGFIVLFWADAGWARYFSKKPGLFPDDFKKMKMFVWAGNPEQMDIMRGLGYQPVGLETADIIPGLSTGMIDTIPLPPFMALAGQVNNPAPNMLDINWAPIVGAAIIRRDTWDKIPPALQSQLRTAAEKAGEKIRTRARVEDDEAILAMKKRGLSVQAATPEAEAKWRELAAKAYPKIRGKMVPAELFDKVQTTLTEFRRESKLAKP